jgi:SAM-dependent methyltransferase
VSPDFGAAARDYATHRAGFPDSLFDRLPALGLGIAGRDIVDIGTGTGTLARGFALRGARVIGIDPDARMLDAARELARRTGASVDFRTGRAEALPLEDASADALSAGQCWHWFDGPAAAREVARVARPGAHVLVAHFDWVVIPGGVAARTEGLIEHHNRAWRMAGVNGFHPESVVHLRAAGFSRFEGFWYDVDVPYTHEAWRGRIRASSGVGASLAAREVEAFDADLAAMLAELFPEPVLAVPHRVFAVVASRG